MNYQTTYSHWVKYRTQIEEALSDAFELDSHLWNQTFHDSYDD